MNNKWRNPDFDIIIRASELAKRNAAYYAGGCVSGIIATLIVLIIIKWASGIEFFKNNRRRYRMTEKDITVYVSADNINAQVEAFLRATSVIKDNEDVKLTIKGLAITEGVVPVKLKLTGREVVSERNDLERKREEVQE